MKFTRNDSFDHVSIEIRDILNIEQMIQDIFLKDCKKIENDPEHKYTSISIDKMISFGENESFSVETNRNSPEQLYFAHSQEIIDKKVTAISITFRSRIDEKRVSVDMIEGNEHSSSLKVKIVSEDRDFVSATMHKFCDIVARIRPSGVFYRQYKLIIRIFGWALWVYCIDTMIRKVFGVFNLQIGHNFDNLSAGNGADNNFYFITYMDLSLSTLIWLGIERQLNKIYPKINFNFGPEHLRPNLLSSKILKFTILTLLIPLSLNVLSSILLSSILPSSTVRSEPSDKPNGQMMNK